MILPPLYVEAKFNFTEAIIVGGVEIKITTEYKRNDKFLWVVIVAQQVNEHVLAQVCWKTTCIHWELTQRRNLINICKDSPLMVLALQLC